MANILDVFKKLGKAFAAVGKFIARFISDAQIDIAVNVVEEAASKFIENDHRREYAVATLQARLGVPESIARWLVETAVLAVKAKVVETIEDFGDKLKAENDPPTV